MVLFDHFGMALKSRQQLFEFELCARSRILPVIAMACKGQKQNASLATFIAEILTDELIQREYKASREANAVVFLRRRIAIAPAKLVGRRSR